MDIACKAWTEAAEGEVDIVQDTLEDAQKRISKQDIRLLNEHTKKLEEESKQALEAKKKAEEDSTGSMKDLTGGLNMPNNLFQINDAMNMIKEELIRDLSESVIEKYGDEIYKSLKKLYN